LLPDGRVLVAGGETFTGGTSFNTAEIYDPATGTWQATGNLNVARDSALAELLSNGEVLIAGGETSNANTPATRLASAELFDPSQGRWTFTGSLPAPGQAIGALLANGDVVDSEVAFYSPATGTWTSVGSSPVKGGSTVSLVSSGKALYTGFRIFVKYCEGCSSDQTLLYDFSTNSYAFTGPLITPRYADSAVLLPNGQVLVSGGIDHSSSGTQLLSSAELYTP
jgi:N-acetylneuraminic acid mutarotase